jgi:hypothetical protein
VFGKLRATFAPMNQSFSTHPYLCSELVTIGSEGSLGVPGNLEAIGQWSALVLTQTPVRRNTEVSIRTEDHVLKGIVEWCTFDEPLGCYLEVRLKPESRWSKQWFRPKHLLALAKRTEDDKSKKCA